MSYLIGLKNEKGLKWRIRDTEELEQYHTNIFISLQLTKDVMLDYLWGENEMETILTSHQ